MQVYLQCKREKSKPVHSTEQPHPIFIQSSVTSIKCRLLRSLLLGQPVKIFPSPLARPSRGMSHCAPRFDAEPDAGLGSAQGLHCSPRPAPPFRRRNPRGGCGAASPRLSDSWGDTQNTNILFYRSCFSTDQIPSRWCQLVVSLRQKDNYSGRELFT